MQKALLTPVGSAEKRYLIGRLSPRERQICRLLCYGRTSKEIGAELKISDKSIDRYVSDLCKDLGVSGRGEVVAWCLQNNVLVPRAYAPLKLHPLGCRCPAVFCTAMRSYFELPGPDGLFPSEDSVKEDLAA